jgi:predicted AlkP superfamily pyrophosphatase or phosphodiesterase
MPVSKARRCAHPLLAALALLLANFAAAPSALAKPVVILISMDGVRYDYPDRAALPAFARIAKDGARAESLTPVFPSITFPAHTSLATGAHPDRHGIGR